MKRIGMVLFAVVMLASLGSVAVAESGDAGAAAPAKVFTVPDSAVPESVPDCVGGEAGNEPNGELEALLSPEPTSAASTCGTCSDSRCVGQAHGALCAYSGGQWLYCRDLLGNFCPGELAVNCSCTSSLPH